MTTTKQITIGEVPNGWRFFSNGAEYTARSYCTRNNRPFRRCKFGRNTLISPCEDVVEINFMEEGQKAIDRQRAEFEVWRSRYLPEAK